MHTVSVETGHNIYNQLSWIGESFPEILGREMSIMSAAIKGTFSRIILSGFKAGLEPSLACNCEPLGFFTGKLELITAGRDRVAEDPMR